MSRKQQQPKKKKKGPTPHSTQASATERKAQTAQDHGPVMEIRTPSQFDTHVLDSERPVLVDFWAPWCGPCQMIAPIFKQMAEKYGDSITFAKVNTDQNHAVASDLNITSLPTLLAFYEGEVVDIKIGAVSLANLEKWVQKVQKKYGQPLDTPEETPASNGAESPKRAPDTSLPIESPSLFQRIRGWFS